MDYFLLWFQFSRRIAAETLATKARMRAKQLSMASIARVIRLCARKVLSKYLMHLSMLSPRVAGGGGAGRPRGI